ncbi:MAG: NAD(P)-dependent oxidoreductase [Bacillota bacterium]|nr:NAD(P)-dependent oxidoreductase [Bacillota bacterium]
MKITVLDAQTLGEDLSLEPLKALGETIVYNTSPDSLVSERIKDCDIIITNKIKLNERNLTSAKKLKLICIAATGYDNIDIPYCKNRNIAVCNVKGYSTHSVAQLTLSMALSLATHLSEYSDYVNSGAYTESGVANCLTPVYHELFGKTWGVIGLGNIGKQVAKVAEAIGCKVIACKKRPDPNYECVDIDTLMRKSDIISVHTPLNDETRLLIDEKRILSMKKTAIFINVSRGAVTDEEALAKAALEGRIGGLGIDVYTKEPFSKNHPFYKILSLQNVCLTPHMAWGAYEARVRCLKEIIENIEAYFNNIIRNRVDL